MSAPRLSEIRAARRLLHELLGARRLSSLEVDVIARAISSPWAAAPRRAGWWRPRLPFGGSQK